MTELLEADAREMLQWEKLRAAGDPEAEAFFNTLFPPNSHCFICDEVIPGVGSVLVLPDWSAKPRRDGRAVCLLAAECEACRAMLPTARWLRITKILRRIRPGWHWPGHVWNMRGRG